MCRSGGIIQNSHIPAKAQSPTMLEIKIRMEIFVCGFIFKTPILWIETKISSF